MNLAKFLLGPAPSYWLYSYNGESVIIVTTGPRMLRRYRIKLWADKIAPYIGGHGALYPLSQVPDLPPGSVCDVTHLHGLTVHYPDPGYYLEAEPDFYIPHQNLDMP